MHTFFKYNTQENKSLCNVCGLKFSGTQATNLKRHSTTKHAENFKAWDSNEDTEVQQCEKSDISHE